MQAGYRQSKEEDDNGLTDAGVAAFADSMPRPLPQLQVRLDSFSAADMLRIAEWTTAFQQWLSTFWCMPSQLFRD